MEVVSVSLARITALILKPLSDGTQYDIVRNPEFSSITNIPSSYNFDSYWFLTSDPGSFLNMIFGWSANDCVLMSTTKIVNRRFMI